MTADIAVWGTMYITRGLAVMRQESEIENLKQVLPFWFSPRHPEITSGAIPPEKMSTGIDWQICASDNSSSSFNLQ